MAVLSVLARNCGGLKQQSQLFKRCATQFKHLYVGQICHMSEKRIFHITPSRFAWNQFKNDLHFYVMLGIIPLGLLVFCVNVFIGPAELAEIPEGYEPKHWEYYPHPIQRFYSRYIYQNPQQVYEKNLHAFHEESEKMKWRKLEKKVKGLMAERDNYRSWYFIPIEGKYHRRTLREEHVYEGKKGF